MTHLKQIPVGRHAIDVVSNDGGHWMFNDSESQLRLVDWWPSTGTYQCPQSGKQGTQTYEDDVLRIAVEECKNKLVRKKAKLVGPRLSGHDLGNARRDRKQRQIKQIYGNLPKPRRR
ncbi:MAG: hypothetical protein AB7K24_06795 [Gemmataceae bacterium]